MNYSNPKIKKIGTDERDVPKVDWYKLFLNVVQVLVNQTFMLLLVYTNYIYKTDC